MGVNDRDWMREPWGSNGSKKDFSVVPLIVGLCVFVFLLGMIWQEPMANRLVPVSQIYGAYSFGQCFELGEYWRLLTYQFVHANMGHIVFNMVALWVFGRAVEKFFGWKHFLVFYLSCGVFAALFSSLLSWMDLFELPFQVGMWIPMVGASGSIYGTLAAGAVMFPHARIALLFPPIEMSVRTFSLLVLGIALIVILMNWNNAGGEAGHLGGMILGFIWISFYRLVRR